MIFGGISKYTFWEILKIITINMIRSINFDNIFNFWKNFTKIINNSCEIFFLDIVWSTIKKKSFCLDINLLCIQYDVVSTHLCVYYIYEYTLCIILLCILFYRHIFPTTFRAHNNQTKYNMYYNTGSSFTSDHRFGFFFFLLFFRKYKHV